MKFKIIIPRKIKCMFHTDILAYASDSNSKSWTVWEAGLLSKVCFYISTASFSFVEIQTCGYSGQGTQHPAAKQVLKSMSYGFPSHILLLAEKKQNPRLPFSTSLCKHWFQWILVLLLGCPASYWKSSYCSQQDASCWQALRAWRLCICSETDR